MIHPDTNISSVPTFNCIKRLLNTVAYSNIFRVILSLSKVSSLVKLVLKWINNPKGKAYYYFILTANVAIIFFNF
jgi:hypothetical protein